MNTYELIFKENKQTFNFQAANKLDAWTTVNAIRDKHNYQSDIIFKEIKKNTSNNKPS